MSKEDLHLGALRAMWFSRRLIERAAEILVATCREMGLKRPSNAVKLFERGWDKVDEVVGRVVDEGAMRRFAMELAEEEQKQWDEAQREYKEAQSAGHDESAAHGGEGGAGDPDGGAPAGVAEAGVDAGPGDVAGEKAGGGVE